LSAPSSLIHHRSTEIDAVTRARHKASSRRRPGAPSSDPLGELYHRPGFMIRRVHQIAVSLFMEETGPLKVTNRQYGILFVIRHRPDIDQISVANLLGLDRSTTGMVLNKLEQDGLISRSVEAADRRRHSVHLTRSGEYMLDKLAVPASRAQTRVLSVFTRREQALFLALLEKLISEFNESTRIPLKSRRPRQQQLPRLDTRARHGN
jgi:DNA-binding MarR family transcriptional regulator